MARRRRRASYTDESVVSRGLVGLPTSPAGLAVLTATPNLAGAALVLGVGLVLIAQRLLVQPELSPFALAMYGAGLILLLTLNSLAGRKGQREISVSAVPGDMGKGAIPRPWLLTGVLVAAVVVWDQVKARPPGSPHADLVVLWVLAMAGVLLASTNARLSRPALNVARSHGGTPVRLEWLIAGCIVLTAVLLRLVTLDRFPHVFGGDEGSQAMSAVAVLEEKLTSPFATGWYSLPTLFFFLQALSIRLFGDSVEGVRAISGLLGAAAVPFTYLLARRLFGRATAVIAAGLLALFHYHLFFSRLASMQIGDPLFLVATLYFLDRGLYEGRRGDCLLAGLAIGLSQYFSFATRIIPLVAIGCVVFALIRGNNGDLAQFRQRTLHAVAWARRLGWMVLGAAIAYLPLLAHYSEHPGEFNSRVNQVSIFTSGWLAREQATGKSTPELLVQQVGTALLLPFHTTPSGWYRGGQPFIGEPMAGAVAIGLAVVSLGAFRREYFGIAIAYWGAMLGLGLSAGAPETQRIVIVTPLLTIFAAVGLTSLARIALTLGKANRAIVSTTLGVIVLGLAAWNIHHFFLAPNPDRLYANENAVVATELAYYLRAKDQPYTIYLAGTPRMVYYGFQTLPFIARKARGIDIERPLRPDSPAPALSGPTMLVFLPERAAELRRVQEWFPGGEVREFRSEVGSLLFTLYEVKRD